MVVKQHKSSKLGIIAGSGDLPEEVIRECKAQNRDIYVIAFEGETAKRTVRNVPHQWFHLGKISAAINALKDEKIKEIVLVGKVARPAISTLRMDYKAMKLLARIIRLRSGGDDAIFSTIIKFLEQNGFKVTGVDKILKSLLMTQGVMGKTKPDKIALNDIDIGKKVAKSIGNLDVGQAVIIQRGHILGVEGAEGTDRLVKRCKELHHEGPGGVLVKMKKPNQDTRVDLPSIGVKTIENAKSSGLCGIAVEAGGSLIINRTKVIKKADELGIFLMGI